MLFNPYTRSSVRSPDQGLETLTAKPRGTQLDILCYGDVAMAMVAPDLGALRSHWPARRPLPVFVAGAWLIVATVHRVVVGCARVEPTPVPFPTDRPSIVTGLGIDQQNEWLSGGLELVELIVDPAARGYGVGSLLEATACSLAHEQRCWIALSGAEKAALPYFLRRGWAAAPAARSGGNGPAVLLSPAHPAVRRSAPGADF